MLAAAIPVSLGIAAADGLLRAWPFVLLVTLAIAGIGGLPIFALLKRQRYPSASAVLGSGFAVGGLFPALGLIANPGAEALRAVAGFGVAGAVGAGLVWRLAIWLTPASDRVARWRRTGAVLAVVAVLVGLPIVLTELLPGPAAPIPAPSAATR